MTLKNLEPSSGRKLAIYKTVSKSSFSSLFFQPVFVYYETVMSTYSRVVTFICFGEHIQILPRIFSFG